MTIDEAIGILDIDFYYHLAMGQEDRWKALRLGIEALNLIKRSRQNFPVSFVLSLPGETEE